MRPTPHNLRRQAREFGLTVDELTALYDAQEERCYICMRRVPLAVDHRHCDGLVRGLLCTRCNSMLLGMIGERPDMYEAAADYLRHPPAIRAVGVVTVPDAPPPGACRHDYH